MKKDKLSPQTLSHLLEEIPGTNPCGEALRYTDVYDKIREARREDDEKLPQGVWKAEYKKADWDYVSSLCEEALIHRSKDLQVAAWLMEAWLHVDGVAGVAQGLELVTNLTRQFWKGLYPQENTNGVELRIAPYEWINLKLSEECQHIHISLPTDRTALPYRMVDYTEATRQGLTPHKKSDQGHSEEGKKPSPVKVSLSIDQTPTAFYRHMDESCTLALKQILELEEELRLHLDEQAPTFYRLREKIESIQRFAHQILDQRGDKKKVATNSSHDNTRKESSSKRTSLRIESRDQAYKVLEEVAAYLERIEPHSPTPYLIRRAISWGDLNLYELFSDILNNGQDISLLLDIVNVKKKPTIPDQITIPQNPAIRYES